MVQPVNDLTTFPHLLYHPSMPKPPTPILAARPPSNSPGSEAETLEAVALAAERHSDEDIDAMRRLAAAQRICVDDPLAFARGDIAFDRAIVRAARNVGFELVLNTFARFPEELPELTALLYDRREAS